MYQYVIKRLENNPLSFMFSIFSLLGGGLLLSYYVHIKVVPWIGLEDLLALILLVSAVGGAFLIYLAVMLIFPAGCWQATIDAPFLKKRYGRQSLNYKGRSTRTGRINSGYISENYLIVAPLLLNYLVLLIFIEELDSKYYILTSIFSGAIVTFIGFIVVNLKAWSDLPVWIYSLFNGCISWVSAWMLILPVFIIGVYIDQSVTDKNIKLGLIPFITIMIFVFNYKTATSKTRGHKPWIKSVYIGVSVIFVLLLFTGNLHFFAKGVLNHFKLGGYVAEQVYLYGRSCSYALTKLKIKKSLNDCHFKNAYVYSTIGKEATFMFTEGDKKLRMEAPHGEYKIFSPTTPENQ
jgi:hypothetical protein